MFTTKQQRFVDAYLGSANGNATKAAIQAGYSEHSARTIGWENLTKPDISAEIRRRLEARSLPCWEVLARLSQQARGIGGYLIVRNGVLCVDLESLLADGLGHLVRGVKQTEQGQNIEFYDAQAALIQLGRYYRLFTDRQEVAGDRENPLVVKHDAEQLRSLSEDEFLQLYDKAILSR